MRKALVAGIVSLGLLTGCGAGNFSMDAGMNIKKNGAIEVLTGSIDPAGPNGQPFEVYGDNKYGIPYKNGVAFNVSSLDLSCKGSTNTVDYRTFASGINDRLTAIVPFSCSDGRTGKVKLILSMGRGSSATGIGKMSDGSEVRLALTSGGQLEW